MNSHLRVCQIKSDDVENSLKTKKHSYGYHTPSPIDKNPKQPEFCNIRDTILNPSGSFSFVLQAVLTPALVSTQSSRSRILQSGDDSGPVIGIEYQDFIFYDIVLLDSESNQENGAFILNFLYHNQKVVNVLPFRMGSENSGFGVSVRNP